MAAKPPKILAITEIMSDMFAEGLNSSTRIWGEGLDLGIGFPAKTGITNYTTEN